MNYAKIPRYESLADVPEHVLRTGLKSHAFLQESSEDVWLMIRGREFFHFQHSTPVMTWHIRSVSDYSKWTIQNQKCEEGLRFQAFLGSCMVFGCDASLKEVRKVLRNRKVKS